MAANGRCLTSETPCAAITLRHKQPQRKLQLSLALPLALYQAVKMPKSKRQRTKALTKVDKKTNDLKQKVVESVREAVDSYATVFAFSFVNMRTNHFKDVRVDFRDSRYVK